MVPVLEQKDRDNLIYTLAKEYLLLQPGVTEEILKEQIIPSFQNRLNWRLIYDFLDEKS